MTVEERIKYAERRLDEAARNDDTDGVGYWRGYIDGIKAIRRDEENEKYYSAR
jgi:hypothetical protein